MFRKALRRFALVVASLAIVFGTVSPALADDITNNIDATVDAAFETLSLTTDSPNANVALSVVTRNGDGKSGCNLTGSTSLVVSAASSNPSVATVPAASMTFTSCGTILTLPVHPVSAGSTDVTLSQVSNNTGGTFNLSPARFTVNVAPPANTPPTVSVTGVTHGGSYTKGSVPAAGCTVNDTEDGPQVVLPVLSAITGPNSIDGIGQQTATCSYTDAGGLTTTAAATYSIVDSSAPAISYVLSPASPNGSNNWYVSPVTLTWTVSEPDSPSTLAKIGCVDQNITGDQTLQTYSCEASSIGGISGPVSVSIKTDGTAPVIMASASYALAGSYDPLSPYVPGTWSNRPIVVHYTCMDFTSGIATCPDDVLVLNETLAAGQDVIGTAIDMAGNSSTVSTNAKLDLTNPNASVTLDRAPDYNGWYNHLTTASVLGSDDLSGIDSCDSPVDYTGPDTAAASVTLGCSDVAGNSGTDTVHFQFDSTKPSLNPNVPATVVLNSIAPAVNPNASDETSGVATSSCGSLDTSTPGVHTVTCIATDNAGNTDSVIKSYAVIFSLGACLGGAGHQVLQPVNTDGSSVFKQGSTVPVKFRVCDANGVSVGSGVVSSFKLVSKASVIGILSVNEDPVSTASDPNFRWDSTSQQWIFNLNTKNLSNNTSYTYEINLTDGSKIVFKFGLK